MAKNYGEQVTGVETVAEMAMVFGGLALAMVLSPDSKALQLH